MIRILKSDTYMSNDNMPEHRIAGADSRERAAEKAKSAETESESEMTIEEAVRIMLGIMDSLQAEGNLDEEVPFIQGCIDRMRSGKITPSEAVRTVMEMSEARNPR